MSITLKDGEKIQLGGYFKNQGDMEMVNIAYVDNEWYLEFQAMWPVSRDASNGGKSEIKLDSKYLIREGIFTVDDFLGNTLRGNLQPCQEKVKNNKDLVTLIDSIINSLVYINYESDGISLLWEYSTELSGINIVKVFSCDKDILVIPDTIDDKPVVSTDLRALDNLPIKRVQFPATMIEIGNIYNCKNLVELSIPAATKKVNSILNCDSLENIFVEKDSKKFKSVNGVLYSKKSTRLIRCPQKKGGVLEIAEKVTIIESDALCDCKNLTGIVMPSKLITIGMYAFRNCTGVACFDLPDTVSEISWGAFENVDKERIHCKKKSYAYDKLKK